MNAIRNLLLGTVAALSFNFGAQAAPPNGTWAFDGNGYSGTLVITVDSANNLSGNSNLAGDKIIGFWSESAQRLMFCRVNGSTNLGTPPSNVQVFTAYQFPVNAAQPTGAQRLAGTFEAFSGTGATASRNVFGWYASK
ncbi:MAG TPA: hypothetical protein VH351_04375 [Bryobacteraceae bacterium]|jgi:hypothetical protein|nr:hypothetical protein [Bryobacteraceae bacterium]